MALNNLFHSYQILLFIGSLSMQNEEQVKEVVKQLGFTKKVYVDGELQMTTNNLYAGHFEGDSAGEVVWKLKNQLYELCKSNEVGMLDFFMIDGTEAIKFKSIWHDGLY